MNFIKQVVAGVTVCVVSTYVIGAIEVKLRERREKQYPH